MMTAKAFVGVGGLFTVVFISLLLVGVQRILCLTRHYSGWSLKADEP